MRLVAHVVSFRGVANVQRIKQDFIFSLTPDWYENHAQGHWFFTRPAVRTGLERKIPLNGALRLTTPHFA